MIVITYKGALYNDKDRVGSIQIKRFIFIFLNIYMFDVSLQSENHIYFIHIFVYI